MTQDELEREILLFRDEMCEICQDRDHFTLGSIAFYALYGAACGYPACCILYFCQLRLRDEYPPKENIFDDRVVCPSCLKDRNDERQENSVSG